MAEHKWHSPPGGQPDARSLGQLQQAVNYPKGMHSDSFDNDLTLPGSGPGSRMMVLGPQTTPVGVTITIQPGAVLRTL